MTEDQYRDMIVSHDRILSVLSASVEAVVERSSKTVIHVDQLARDLSSSNVLTEKVHNMNENTAESFKRAWKRLEILEDPSRGCSLATELSRESISVKEKLVAFNKRAKELEIASVTLKESHVSPTTIRWGLGILFVIIMGAIGAGDKARDTTRSMIAANKERIYRLDMLATEKIQMQREKNTGFNKSDDRLAETLKNHLGDSVRMRDRVTTLEGRMK